LDPVCLPAQENNFRNIKHYWVENFKLLACFKEGEDIYRGIRCRSEMVDGRERIYSTYRRERIYVQEQDVLDEGDRKYGI
jgi:hypothetical protein